MMTVFFSARQCVGLLQCIFNGSGRTAKRLFAGLTVLAIASVSQRTFADLATITVIGWTCPANTTQVWDGDTLIGCRDPMSSLSSSISVGDTSPPGGGGPGLSAPVPTMATIEHASNCVEANGGQPARKQESFSDMFAFERPNGSVYFRFQNIPKSPSDLPVFGQTGSSSGTVYFEGSYQAGVEDFGVGTPNPGWANLTGFEQLMWTMAHERIHQYGNTNQKDGAGEYYDTEAHKVLQSYWSHGHGANCK